MGKDGSGSGRVLVELVVHYIFVHTVGQEEAAVFAMGDGLAYER